LSKKYLISKQVRKRYGDRSQMWIWRRLKYDPKFPRPILLGNRQHFDEAELDAYDEALRAEAAATVAA
jgi:predicted DNA-binding transcriptional regulator AlpA